MDKYGVYFQFVVDIYQYFYRILGIFLFFFIEKNFFKNKKYIYNKRYIKK